MQKLSSPKSLLVGLYGAGMFYALLVISEGVINFNTISALLLEVSLLIASILKDRTNKKGLAVLILFIFGYLWVAFGLIAVFEGFEVTVMAAAGVAIYAAVTSEPKFPLTKRAISTGIVVGIIITFLGIYLALKLGVVYFVGAELLGFLVLTVHGRYTPEENTIVVSIANTSSMVSIGVLITFPAIAIFQPAIAVDLITYQFIVFVTGISALFGLLLMAPFREKFDDEPWPQIQPQAETIKSLGAEKEAKQTVVTGLLAAGAWTALTKIAEVPYVTIDNPSPFGSFPHAVASTVPDWIGISNSPLIAAIGFFVGWKRTIVMAVGSLLSLLIWIFLEGAISIPFGEHLTRPEILYLALGTFATVILGDVLSSKDTDVDDAAKAEWIEEDKHVPPLTIGGRMIERVKSELFSLESVKEEIRQIVDNPREYMVRRRGQLPPWVAVVSIVLFITTGVILFSVIRPFTGLDISWLLFVFGAPIALISAYFTAKSICETGMLAGYISDMVAIPAILFFRVSFSAITTFMSMLGALQDAGIAMLVHLKLGQMTGVRGKTIGKAVGVGALLGTFVGSLITYGIYILYGFGNTDFPAPAAQLFGFLINSLSGLGNLQLPGFSNYEGVHPVLVFIYLISFGAIGFLLGRFFIKRGLSPMSLAVGLLIPPATTVAILIGGFVDYRLKKKYPNLEQDASEGNPSPTERKTYEKTSRLLSGIVAGEAIVTVIWVLWSALNTLL